MKVFLAGATGVLGRRLVRQFHERGIAVVGLVRNARGEDMVRSHGGHPVYTDIFNPDDLARHAEGCDVVIHAATSIPVKTKPKVADWAMNDRLRREGTQALTACAARIGARTYIQQSVIWVARPSDGGFFDETSPVRLDPISQSAYDGEVIAQAAAEKHGFNVAVLRCGWFYGPDAAHTRFFAEGLKKRRLPIIGSGAALWSCLHLDDAAGAFVTAAEMSLQGVWHVVDDHPVRVADFIGYFAERLKAPSPVHIPVWLARLIAGSYAVDFFTKSVHTSNGRFCAATGWTPRYPSYREGIDGIIRTWMDEHESGL